jgi:hypothetical protein
MTAPVEAQFGFSGVEKDEGGGVLGGRERHGERMDLN